MIDISKLPFMQLDVYRDFDGMPDAKPLIEACRDGDKYVWDVYAIADSDTGDLRVALRSIVLNILSERQEYGETLNLDIAYAICGTAYEMLRCARWSEVTDGDIEAILTDKE